MTQARVGITTTADRAEPLRMAAARRGLRPVLLPCITVTPARPEHLSRFRQAADRADWIVLTSSRPVALLWPQGDMPPIPVAAVGEATARAVERAGGTVKVTGTRGAVDLLHQLGTRIKGARVFYPHGQLVAADITRRLEEAGARITAAVAYRTEPIGPGPDPVEGVIFGSPSAVRGWCLTRSFDDVVVAVTGATTAAAVRAAGYPYPHQPTKAGFKPALDLFAQALREKKS